MRHQGLVACQPRPFRITTEADAQAAAGMPDLVNRDFTADLPGVKFVGDITYIHTSADFSGPGGQPGHALCDGPRRRVLGNHRSSPLLEPSFVRRCVELGRELSWTGWGPMSNCGGEGM